MFAVSVGLHVLLTAVAILVPRWLKPPPEHFEFVAVMVVPPKALGIEEGVNITVGLPVIRTSVDHGTAFDIAGTGTAEEASLLEALRQAVELAPQI